MPPSLNACSNAAPFAVVADADAHERARCLRVLAAQTPLHGIGVGSWEELQTVTEALSVALILYGWGLPGAPEDAVAQLVVRAGCVIVVHQGERPGLPPGSTAVARPVTADTLAQLGRSAAHANPPPTFVTADFVQMLCHSGESHVVVVSDVEGADAGVIEVRLGEIWTAIDGLGAGEDAFSRLMRPGTRARVGRPGPTAKSRTIFKASHELVLESMRRFDEGTVAGAPPLDSAQLDAILEPEPAERIGQLNADARKLLAVRDYDMAARVLLSLSELDPTSTLARANLEQLRRLGYPR